VSARGAGAPILVVESDRRLGRALTEQLAADGFDVELASTAEHARVLASASAPRIALLGWLDSPPGALELLREIRRGQAPDTPWDGALPAIVMATRAQELDMLRAFEAGADDFLSRAAAYVELRARLRAILRRSAGAGAVEWSMRVGPLVIDTRAHHVTLDGTEVRLRRMEFELLVHLAREPERVFAKAELLRSVWGYRSGGSTRTLDSHASRLRRKLESDDGRRWVISVWGVGYRLI
jgi:DNA-binding response OmpR family regulator